MSAVILRTNYVVDGFSTAFAEYAISETVGWYTYLYTLGYGTTDSGTIPAYSTLVFDITLLALSPRRNNDTNLAQPRKTMYG